MPKGRSKRKKAWHTRVRVCNTCGWKATASVEVGPDQMHHAGFFSSHIGQRECLRCTAEVGLKVCPCVRCRSKTPLSVPNDVPKDLIQSENAPKPQGVLDARLHRTPENKGDSEISDPACENAAQDIG